MQKDDFGSPELPEMRGGGERQTRLEELILASLRAWDPDAVVRTKFRPNGMADITVISRRFEGRDSREREADFWPTLDPVPKSEMVYLTYCLLLAPEEADRSFGDRPVVSVETEDWDE